MKKRKYTMQQGGKSYNGKQQEARFNQFFPSALQDKYKAVQDLYGKQYPTDTRTVNKLRATYDAHGNVLDEDFQPGDLARSFPEFDSDYQQYQQKLIQADPKELVEMIHGLSGVTNPLQLLSIKTPAGLSKWDMVKLGMKIKEDRKKYTFQQGGDPTLQEPENQVIVEGGEMARDLDGNLVQIHPQAPSHDDPRLVTDRGFRKVKSGKGGIVASNLESVLSDSQSQINSGERTNNLKDAIIKIRPKQAQAIGEELGLNVKTGSSMSPTKLFHKLQEARDSQAKKYTLKDKYQDMPGKPFQEAQRINSIQQRALPTDNELYDHIFGIQEASKQILPDFENQPNQTMQHGGPTVRGKANWSLTGYKRDSPDRFEPYLTIPGPNITMKGVDHPVMLYGDGGEQVMAQPGKEYELPDSSSVLEVPTAQQGKGPARNWLWWNEYKKQYPKATSEDYDFYLKNRDTMKPWNYPTFMDRLTTSSGVRNLFPQGTPAKPADLDLYQQNDRGINRLTSPYDLPGALPRATGTGPVSSPEDWQDLTTYPTPAKPSRFKMNPGSGRVAAPTVPGTQATVYKPDTSQANLSPDAQNFLNGLTNFSGQTPVSPQTGPQVPYRYQDERDPAVTESVNAASVIPVDQPALVPASKNPLQKLVNPFKPDALQFLPDALLAIDSMKRAPILRQQLSEQELHLDRLNSTAARQDLTNAYRGAQAGIPDPGTQMGRAQGVTQYTGYLNALNNLNGQYDQQNVGISNQEEQYNNQMRRQVEGTNLQLNDQWFERSTAADEAGRQQFFQALQGASTKLATAKQQERNYNLFKSAYSPKFGVSETGEVQFDSSGKPVVFGNGSMVVDPANPYSRNKTEVVRDKDGKIKQTKVTQEDLNFLNQNREVLKRLGLSVKQQGGKIQLKSR